MKTVMSAADRKRALKKVIRDSDQARRTIAANRKALNGEETVDIHVNVDELYDPLSMPDQRRLAGEIYEFIEDSVDLYSSLVPIRAILHGVPEEDRGGVLALIRAHYERNLQENLWERRENTLKMVSMFIIGVLVISLYLTLAIAREDSIVLELLSVIGSFALWEATNCYLLERRAIKRKLMATAQLMTMEISFEE